MPEPTITPPPDVAALLDEASIEGGPYSALVCRGAVQLVETVGRRVVREVAWEQAGQWGEQVLKSVLS